MDQAITSGNSADKDKILKTKSMWTLITVFNIIKP